MAEIVTRIVTIAPQLRSAESDYMGPLSEGIRKREKFRDCDKKSIFGANFLSQSRNFSHM